MYKEKKYQLMGKATGHYVLERECGKYPKIKFITEEKAECYGFKEEHMIPVIFTAKRRDNVSQAPSDMKDFNMTHISGHRGTGRGTEYKVNWEGPYEASYVPSKDVSEEAKKEYKRSLNRLKSWRYYNEGRGKDKKQNRIR